MTILLLAEHDNKALSDQTHKTMTAALQLGDDISVLVCGDNCEVVANQAASMTGATQVLLADHSAYANQLAEPVADLIISLASTFDAILAPATSNGKNIMPRVAALLDVMQISDVIAIDDTSTFQRPIYAGNAIQTVHSVDKIKVVTVRTAGFDACTTTGNAEIKVLESLESPPLSVHIKDELSVSERPELTSANIVISGGRALGSKEHFDEYIIPLADALGAAVGASRAAVDAGYAPNDWQVGQTGKIVAPNLYIACGISGAIQHLAGMKDSKVIVAINKDEDAPIFQVADYGLVADIFEVLPQLKKAVEL